MKNSNKEFNYDYDDNSKVSNHDSDDDSNLSDGNEIDNEDDTYINNPMDGNDNRLIIVEDHKLKIERVVFPLEGVKFLSLNNRSHLEGNLNPRKLGIVDSVLRDLEIEKLKKEVPEVVLIKEEVIDIIPVVYTYEMYTYIHTNI